MLQKLLNLIFPPKCVFCRSLLPFDTGLEVCDACHSKLPFIKEGRLELFGGGMTGNKGDGVICLFEYTGMVREALIRYKFNNKPGYFRLFSELLARKIQKDLEGVSPDLVVSVPLSPQKKAKRGYNQAFLLSKALSRKLKIPEASRILYRTRDTGSQSLLSRRQRELNVKDAFAVKEGVSFTGRTVLLVDDIMTTGATLAECVKALQKAGASRIIPVVVASGRNRFLHKNPLME